MILETITNEFYWVIIAILALNLFQRKHQPRSNNKRTATLLAAVLVLLLNLLYVMIINFELPQWTAVPALFIPLAVGYLLRSKINIFRIKCVSCGAKLTFNEIAFHDDNLCAACHREQFPELYVDEQPEEGDVLPEPAEAESVDQIDWDSWEPTETAVICYVFDGDRVLLINKKTGLGSGMVNAPGGRIEPAETAIEAAVRETEEETGITPLDPVQVGVLNFQFTDGYSLRGYAFFAWDHTGDMKETDEAIPFWVPVDEIPYDSMWEDDRYWLPEALAGKNIAGYFIFDDRKMLSIDVQSSDRP
jgi:8-oxo-dGTP diphosphatase